MKGLFQARKLTTMSATSGRTPGLREELVSVVLPVDTIRSFVRLSSVGHLIPFSGSQNTSLWTESRSAGVGNSGWPGGMPTSFCGKCIQT